MQKTTTQPIIFEICVLKMVHHHWCVLGGGGYMCVLCYVCMVYALIIIHLRVCVCMGACRICVQTNNNHKQQRRQQRQSYYYYYYLLFGVLWGVVVVVVIVVVVVSAAVVACWWISTIRERILIYNSSWDFFAAAGEDLRCFSANSFIASSVRSPL